jgi:hypothetical protein
VFISRPGYLLSWLRIFIGVRQLGQVNTGIRPQTRTPPFPFTSFPIHHSSSNHLTLYNLSFYLISWGAVKLRQHSTAATNWPIVPAPDDIWRVWTVGGMRIGRRNRRTRRNTTPVLLCPPQVPHDQQYIYKILKTLINKPQISKYN